MGPGCPRFVVAVANKRPSLVEKHKSEKNNNTRRMENELGAGGLLTISRLNMGRRKFNQKFNPPKNVATIK